MGRVSIAPVATPRHRARHLLVPRPLSRICASQLSRLRGCSSLSRACRYVFSAPFLDTRADSANDASARARIRSHSQNVLSIIPAPGQGGVIAPGTVYADGYVSDRPSCPHEKKLSRRRNLIEEALHCTGCTWTFRPGSCQQTMQSIGCVPFETKRVCQAHQEGFLSLSLSLSPPPPPSSMCRNTEHADSDPGETWKPGVPGGLH